MAVFSTQQVRQFYVVGSKVTPASIKSLATAPGYPDATKKGRTALSVFSGFDHSVAHPSNAGTTNMSKAFKFLHVNSLGEIISSDLIWRQSIRSITLKKASDLLTKLPTVEVKLTTTTFGSTTLAAGDGNVYYLHFRLPGFQNATDEEVLTRTVSFTWDSGNWSAAAEAAINDAFAKKHNMYNNLLVAEATDSTTVEIYAPEGKWVRGLHTNKPNRIEIAKPEVEIFSDATMSTIPASANYRVKECGTAEDKTATTSHTVVNSKTMADLEWFCMGERADQFRYAGWPNYVATEYSIAGTEQYGFDVLDIHYYFQGEGINDDKSEKQLTLVVAADNTGNVNSDLQSFYNIICGNADADANSTPSAGGVVTESVYEQVTTVGTENPKTEGWYELNGSSYELTDDTTVGQNVDYYEHVMYTEVIPETGSENPQSKGWYEKSGTTYSASTDTTVNTSDTYYTRTVIA